MHLDKRQANKKKIPTRLYNVVLILRFILVRFMTLTDQFSKVKHTLAGTGELGYDRLNETRKIGPSYAKSVVYI